MSLGDRLKDSACIWACYQQTLHLFGIVGDCDAIWGLACQDFHIVPLRRCRGDQANFLFGPGHHGHLCQDATTIVREVCQ